MTAVEDIKARIDVLDLIGESVKLRRSGKNYVGFCPFHQNVHTPAFAVFPESGTWRCFGSCNEGGDIFRYVMKKQGCDFPEALRILAERAGVELHQRTEEQARADEVHARLRTLLDLAAGFYRSYLLQSPEGGPVREYLSQRNLAETTLEAFEIGLAPSAWEEALAYFRGKEYSDEDLLAAGLAVQNQGGGLRDRFRHRIMIPIRDAAGRMCGFGARVVEKLDQPKFINSPQSPLFDKGRLLYGLDRATRAIRSAQEAVVVEGYLDVIAVHQAGFENAVSPMGTALTENQLRMLKRYARRIVLALDPDSAGASATMRGLEIARGALDREGEPVFDSRGLLRYEGRLQTEMRVANLPDNLDPDEVVNADPADWKRRIAEAQPVVQHVLSVLLRDQNTDDPKVKAGIAARLIPLIEDVASPVERDAYRQQVARALRVDERTLLTSTTMGASRRTARPSNAPQTAAISRPQQREAFVVGMLARDPEMLFRVDRLFGELGLERIGANDFSRPDYSALFGHVRDSALQDSMNTDLFLHSHIPEEIVTALQEARDHFRKYHGEAAASLEEALEVLLRLRKSAMERQLADIRYYLSDFGQEELEAASESGQAQQEALGRVNAIRKYLHIIDRAFAERLRSVAG